MNEEVGLWRCTECGKWSHAKRRPGWHERFTHEEPAEEAMIIRQEPGPIDYASGEAGDLAYVVRCGPFEEWRAERGPVVPEFQLGDKVTVAGTIHRETLAEGKVLWPGDFSRGKVRREWVPSPWSADTRQGAVVVGKRTLANGVIEECNEGSWETPVPSERWRPDHFFQAYQVAFDLRCKPVYALPDQLEAA